MKRITFLLISAFICTQTFLAATYYVDAVNGLNTNSGLSTSQAIKALYKAAEKTVAGDTVLVMNGTYTNTTGTPLITETDSGLPNDWIVWKNYPGHSPVLSFWGWQGIYIKGSYVEINGLIIRGNNANVTLNDALSQPGSCNNPTGTPLNGAYNGNGIQVDGRSNAKTHHTTVKNCTIYECGGSGIQMIQTDYILVENNTIYNNAWYSIYAPSGISIYQCWNSDLETGVKNIIRNNRCFGNKMLVPWPEAGCKFTDGNGIIFDDSKNTQGGSTLGVYNGRTLITNNIVYNNGGSGIHTFSSEHVDIINNTAYQNSQSVEIDNGEIFPQMSNDIKIINNILYSSPGQKINSNMDNGSGIVYDYNMHFGDGSAALTGNYTLNSDPLFTNAASGDFSTADNSPVRNAGIESFMGVTTPTSDINGNPRPFGAGIEIGAIEFNLEVSPTTIPNAPLNLVATPGSNRATISFDAPVSNGGSGINYYTATANPGNITSTAFQSKSGTLSISGLENGITYTITMTATNSIGTGPVSIASNHVTPIYGGLSNGNIVVSVVGDGVTPITNSCNNVPVSICEYNTIDASQVSPVTTINLNATETGTKLTLGGNQGEGQLSLSEDSLSFLISGYDNLPGLPTTTHRQGNKTIVKIAKDGTVQYFSTAYGAGQASRNAVSTDGSSFWHNIGNLGISYFSETNLISNATGFGSGIYNRTIEIINGQLYAISGDVISYSNPALPIASGATSASITLPNGGTTTSPVGFAMLDRNPTVGWNNTGLDLIYIADANGGIRKLYYDGTSWVFLNKFSNATSSPYGYSGLAVRIESGMPTLYTTSGPGNIGGNKLLKITDSYSYNEAMWSATVTTLATAGLNYAFKGVTFVPAQAQLPHYEPEIYIIQASNNIADDSGSFDFGDVNIGDSCIVIFTIQNIGNSPLTLSGTANIAVTGNGFSLKTDAMPVINPNETSTFEIRFIPESSSQYIGSVTISNNDADENPYNFTITGNGIAPPVNLISNSTFDINTDNWTLAFNGGAATMTNLVQPNYSGKACRITITKKGTVTNSVQLRHALPLTAGKSYVLNFKASATAARTIGVSFQQNISPWTIYHTISNIRLSTTPQTYGPYTFDCNVNDATDMFKFLLGKNASTVYIDDVSIVESSTMYKIKSFIAEDNKNIRSENFRAYPNPATNKINVEYDATNKDDVTMAVYDTSGRIIIKQRINNSAIGPNLHQIDLNSISNGVYILKILSNSLTDSKYIFVKK